MTACGLHDRPSIPDAGRYLFLPSHNQPNSGIDPGSYTVGTESLFLWGKASGAGSWPLISIWRHSVTTRHRTEQCPNYRLPASQSVTDLAARGPEPLPSRHPTLHRTTNFHSACTWIVPCLWFTLFGILKIPSLNPLIFTAFCFLCSLCITDSTEQNHWEANSRSARQETSLLLWISKIHHLVQWIDPEPPVEPGPHPHAVLF